MQLISSNRPMRFPKGIEMSGYNDYHGGSLIGKSLLKI